MKSSDSIFNKMSDKQWKRLEKEKGWTVGKKEFVKELDKLIAQQEADEALRQQTEMFWLLQLQFLNMDKNSEHAFNVFFGILCSPIYKKNAFTDRMRFFMFEVGLYNVSQEEFECLCTHFALQLAVIKE